MAQRQFASGDTDTWSDRFGDGSDGVLTISGATTKSASDYAGCSGTGGATAVTIDAAGNFADGDIVMIHQSRGTGVGVWELNKISSGGTTTSLTMAYDLIQTYTNTGDSQAQIIRMQAYSSVSVETGITFDSPVWDENKCGILPILCNGTTSIVGNIVVDGLGFRNDGVGAEGSGQQGEGTTGAAGNGRTANGNGGGAGADFQNSGGAGGGNVAVGTAGTGGQGGIGGEIVGNAALTVMDFGGEGGGGSKGTGANGGNGGGIVLIISDDISITGTISTDGTAGSTANNSGAGGGAGGSILLKCLTGVLGTDKMGATSGAGGGGTSSGGAGSIGRIHADYATSLTGSTTTPSLDSTQDLTLLASVSGGNPIFFSAGGIGIA